MVIFYKKWKNYNEFQLTKNKMDLNIRKMTNHPPSPVTMQERDSIMLTSRRGLEFACWHWGWKEMGGIG